MKGAADVPFFLHKFGYKCFNIVFRNGCLEQYCRANRVEKYYSRYRCENYTITIKSRCQLLWVISHSLSRCKSVSKNNAEYKTDAAIIACNFAGFR